MSVTETYYDLSSSKTYKKQKGYFIISGEVTELEYVVIDNKAILQGDIIIDTADNIETSQKNMLKITPENCKAALIELGKRWSNYQKVPYKIDPGAIVNVDRIEQAIKTINEKTNIKFVPAGDGDINYILIKEDIDGLGSSCIGCEGNEQIVHLNKEGNFKVGNVIHELCHALGLWHEHTRQDRDTYVTIEDGNIVPGKEINFTTCTPEEEIDQGNYDYDSIMHYYQYAFSKDKKNKLRTIITKNPDYQDKIGQRQGLSDNDIKGLNELCK